MQLEPSAQAMRVLLVDDDDDDYVLTRDLLVNISDLNIRVDWASTYAQALEQLAGNQHDLCLLDYQLGARSGLELLEESRSIGCRVPFILLTGQGNRLVDLEAMKSGAVYYLDKNHLNVFDLERAVRYSLERAQMLRVVQDLNAGLEERVVERTAELRRVNHELALEIEQRKLAEQRLLEALEIERENNRLKTDFITTMSHEFRTPLSIILSSTDILRLYEQRTTPEQRQSRYEQIIGQVYWMNGLLDNLLTIRKAEAGETTVTRREIALESFCQVLIDDIRPTVRSGQALIFECDCGSLNAMLDEALLRQILYNLLTNAIKFTSEGGRIQLSLTCVGGEAILTVSDNGIGIPPADLPHIFDIFRRGSNVDAVGGTGLGLAIVRHSVEMLDGTITVESRPNAGTTFTIRLPVSSTITSHG